MEFQLGVMTGLISALIIMVTVFSFRTQINTTINRTKSSVDGINPFKAKGEIYWPEEEEDARQEIINKNNAMGKDTHIDELL